MIQDSINQLLDRAAIGTRLGAEGIQGNRASKMAKLNAKKAELTAGNLDPTQLEAMVNPQEKIAEVEGLQKKINKLGNSKFFPSPKLANTAAAENANTNAAVMNFKQGFSPEARKAMGIQLPSEIEAQKRIAAEKERTQRLKSGVENRQARKSFMQSLPEQSEEKLIGGN